MNEPRTIYFTSPWMPCGAFGIVNCLMEMGIKVSTYRHAHEDWSFDGKYHYPNTFNRFKAQFPAFADNERFEFRDDIHVIWGHIFPYDHLYRHKVFMYTRDPRDALFHQYSWEKRMADINYADWLRWPFHETLLDNIDSWLLYHRLWRQHPHLAAFRYEDTCKSPRKMIGRLLDYLGVEVEEERIEKALWSSSYERYCQMKDRPFDPEEKRYDKWRDRENEEQEQIAIEQAAGSIMKLYRYMPVHEQKVQEVDPFPHMALNPFFKDIPYYGSQNPDDVATNPYLQKIFAFMRFIKQNPESLPQHVTKRQTWEELNNNFAGYQLNAVNVGLLSQQEART